MKQITIVIPIYNGEKYIKDTCGELEDFFKNNQILKEIIFVNDGSTDSTFEKLEDIKNKYSFSHQILTYKKNQGKGHAIKHALERIKTDLVGFTDVELPYGLNKLNEGARILQTCDLVVGKREMSKQRSRYRECMSKFFSLLLPSEVRKVHDTQCGFKLFRTEVAQEFFSNIKTFRWVFDVELFLIAKIKKYKICEIPVVIKKKCLKSKGGVSFFRHGIRILLDLVKLRRGYKL